MVTITHRLALQLRSVLRRAFGRFRGKGPAVGFFAEKEGLTVRSSYSNVAVEFRLPGERPTDTLWLPFEFLADVEGKSDEPVELTASSDNQISVQWRTGNVPQIANYESKIPDATESFPAQPIECGPEQIGLLQALHEASEVASDDNHRFAINCLQLDPNGSVTATDGRQLIICSGFSFPWQEPVLVQRSKVFASPELQQDKPVAVGQSGDWVAILSGRWTIFLRHNTGTFPNVSRSIVSPESAKARCQLSKDNVKFLIETLPQLPCDEDQHFPVTIDLNGHIAIRAKSADQVKPTEVLLTNSRWAGEPIRINTNRTYLQRALKLGIQDLCLYASDAALTGLGSNRRYVWMPLLADSAIPPAEGASASNRQRAKSQLRYHNP